MSILTLLRNATKPAGYIRAELRLAEKRVAELMAENERLKAVLHLRTREILVLKRKLKEW